jgi:hypothetical protein
MFTNHEESVKMLSGTGDKTRRGLRRESALEAHGVQGFKASYRKEQ